MGKQCFFVTFDSDDVETVQAEWDAYCAQDMATRRIAGIQKLRSRGIITSSEEPGTHNFETAIFEQLSYEASPLSFDNCRLHFADKPDSLSTPDQVRQWILQTHEKWTPALAVVVDEQTLVGGWVSV